MHVETSLLELFETVFGILVWDIHIKVGVESITFRRTEHFCPKVHCHHVMNSRPIHVGNPIQRRKLANCTALSDYHAL